MPCIVFVFCYKPANVVIFQPMCHVLDSQNGNELSVLCASVLLESEEESRLISLQDQRF